VSVPDPHTPLAVRRRFVLVLGFLTGLAAVTVDMSLPAIPSMVVELATTMAYGQQIIGWFIAGIAVGQLPAGLVSDRIGRLPVLYFGIVLFTLAGILCAASTSIEPMLAGRFLQGMGASVGIVVSRAIVRDIASGAAAARLLTVMVMIFTAAPMIAPIVGSFLVSLAGWRAPFIAIVVFGGLMFWSVGFGLTETRRPVRDTHILAQLWASVKEFFSHRQCIFAMLLVMLVAAGFMAVITSASALVIEIYGFEVRHFGFIFAVAACGILAGSTLNRRLIMRHGSLPAMRLGTAIIGLAAVSMLAIAWLGQVPFWWLWGTVSLYMVGTGLTLPNAVALALDPVPEISGVASSLIGTIQNVAAAASSIVGSLIYDGTPGRVVINMAVCGAAVFLLFAGRNLLMGGRPLHVPDPPTL